MKRYFTHWLNTGLFLCLLGLTFPAYSQKQDEKLIPFFDNQDNPVPVANPRGQQLDISPPAPQLNEFDQALLQACGDIGTNVNPERFKQLMRSHSAILQEIQQAAGGELRPGRKGNSEFIQDLTNIWFQHKGFDHIFCGEVRSAQKIGGLHFAGRYLQLQNQGIAGILPNNEANQEAIPGVAYTFGVVIKQGNKTMTDTLKGYGYLSNAEEILVDATRLFKQQETFEGACIANIKDVETGKTIPTVFVRKEGAIVTYYPDATPQGIKCKGN
jgi:Bacterial EndoU nuclease